MDYFKNLTILDKYSKYYDLENETITDSFPDDCFLSTYGRMYSKQKKHMIYIYKNTKDEKLKNDILNALTSNLNHLNTKELKIYYNEKLYDDSYEFCKYLMRRLDLEQYEGFCDIVIILSDLIKNKSLSDIKLEILSRIVHSKLFDCLVENDGEDSYCVNK